jgi:hypothetical protein
LALIGIDAFAATWQMDVEAVAEGMDADTASPYRFMKNSIPMP